MTEKKKMLTGQLYNGLDAQLVEERQIAKELLFDYHALRPNQRKKKDTILKQLLGGIKGEFFIEPPFRCDYGSNIEIGENFYSNYNCVMLDGAKITIGDNVLLGPNVGIFAAGHPVEPEIRLQGLEYTKPITIGNNVWIGGNVAINPGVSIGDNTVIGSGSVVTKNIPANVVAVGNPCKIIKTIKEEGV